MFSPRHYIHCGFDQDVEPLGCHVTYPAPTLTGGDFDHPTQDGDLTEASRWSCAPKLGGECSVSYDLGSVRDLSQLRLGACVDPVVPLHAVILFVTVATGFQAASQPVPPSRDPRHGWSWLALNGDTRVPNNS